MIDVLRAVDVDRGLATLKARLRQYGLTTETAAREAARHWPGLRAAFGVATLGMVQLPPLPSWLHDAAKVADALVLGPPRAGGINAHAESLRFFAWGARTLAPFAGEMAMVGLGLSGLGPLAAQVPAVVGGVALAETIIGSIVAVVGSEVGAVVCLVLGLALLVVAAWAWAMVKIGAPEAWEREADELEAAPDAGVKTPPIDFIRAPGDLVRDVYRGRADAGVKTPPIDFIRAPGDLVRDVYRGRADKDAKPTDGLELGELVAVAGLLWAIFGR